MPWSIDKDQIRNERIDKMATKMLADKALKIITEAYEVVFEANEEDKNIEEKAHFNGKNSDKGMETEDGNGKIAYYTRKGTDHVENSTN